jgi:hypothetical protein
MNISPEDARRIGVHEVEWSKRTLRSIERLGIKTLGDLADKFIGGVFLNTPGIGKVQTSEIDWKLTEFGIAGIAALSTRAQNCLILSGIYDKEAARAALLGGRLYPKKVRNYGKHTHAEVLTWLGIPIPQKGTPQIKTCPHCGGLL